jgi:hypothetical protein
MGAFCVLALWVASVSATVVALVAGLLVLRSKQSSGDWGLGWSSSV